MTKKFEKLRVGEKFYIPSSDGTIDIRFQLIKISCLNLTQAHPWPDTLKTTPNVLKGQKNGNKTEFNINSVVISSPNETNGFYEFIPDDLMVYPENLTC